MKPSYAIALAVFLGATATPARGQLPPRLPAVPPPDPTPPSQLLPPPTPLPAPPVRKADGQVAVLADGRLVEGAITVSPAAVVVRKGSIETTYPAGDVKFVGPTRDDAYRYKRGTVADGDAAGRLAVAKWCSFNGMRENALAEARGVLQIDPANAAADAMARTLEESLRKFPPAGAAAAPPEIPPSQSARPPVGLPAVDPEPGIDLEAAATFRTRVQPVLVNLCADCHARGDITTFKLVRVEGRDAPQAATRANLRAALAHVRRGDPAASPLLALSLAAHGGQKLPAFVTPQAPAYRALAEWASSVAGPATAAPLAPPSVTFTPAAPLPPPEVNPLPPVAPPTPSGLPALPPVEPDVRPTPPPVRPTVTPTVPFTPQKLPVVPPPPGVSGRPAPAPTAGVVPAKLEERFGQDVKPPEPTGPSPTNAGAPVDEFDPSVFNRAVHPERTGGAK